MSISKSIFLLMNMSAIIFTMGISILHDLIAKGSLKVWIFKYYLYIKKCGFRFNSHIAIFNPTLYHDKWAWISSQKLPQTMRVNIFIHSTVWKPKQRGTRNKLQITSTYKTYTNLHITNCWDHIECAGGIYISLKFLFLTSTTNNNNKMSKNCKW